MISLLHQTQNFASVFGWLTIVVDIKFQTSEEKKCFGIEFTPGWRYYNW